METRKILHLVSLGTDFAFANALDELFHPGLAACAIVGREAFEAEADMRFSFKEDSRRPTDCCRVNVFLS
jgi:hypothetical protein